MGNDQSNAAMPGVLREPSGTSQHPSLGIGLDPARVPTSTAVQEDTAAHQAVLKTVKGHHKKAYQLLNEALDQDQAKAIHRARQLYHEGLSAMQQGLEVDATGESPALLEARHLQAKMRANHEQIKARLDELSQFWTIKECSALSTESTSVDHQAISPSSHESLFHGSSLF
eukprot:TRINITY_DN12260_c0_g2_i5.p1 TRINITY_DN12260_c0_g2~~TRINITY_DN12260_c0_g2_i5.p1  ORF type:complete len:171 (+),score=34.89 TRINITY_DN12260_c0_g2_i5:57-569(+)